MSIKDINGTLLSFGQAMELAKQGVAVSNINWGFQERVSGHIEPMRVHASKIWSLENCKAASRNSDQSITVRPYLTKVDGNYIDNWLPSAKDIYDPWMRSSVYPRLSRIELVDDEDQIYKLSYDLFAEEYPNHPFWMLYEQEMIGYNQLNIVIGGSNSVNHRNLLLLDQLSAAVNCRSIYLYHELLKEELLDPTQDNEILEEYGDDGIVQYAILIETGKDYDVEEDFRRLKEHTDPVNVFIDVDSLNEMNLYNKENALEYVKSQVMMIAEDKPNINWVAFSLKEQMQIIASTSEEQAGDDETYALKAD